MTGKKYHFALIGAGAMGKRWAGILSKSKNVSLDVIVDTDINKANSIANIYKGVKASNNLDELLKNKAINAAVVVVPHKFLAPLTGKLLLSGKHVMVEKPGAISSNLIRKNISLAKKKKLSFVVGFNHRFHQGFIKARNLFGKGLIGDLLFIRSRYGFGGRFGYEKEWRLSKNISGGGELIDQGVHMIDLAISFMGKPDAVKGFAVGSFWKSDSDDNSFVLLRKKNVVTSIHVSLTQWQPLHNFELYGTKGFISVEGLGRKYGGTEVVRFGIRSDDFSSLKKERVFNCNPDADKSLRLELDYFLDNINQSEKDYTIAESAFDTLRVVEKIYLTSKL